MFESNAFTTKHRLSTAFLSLLHRSGFGWSKTPTGLGWWACVSLHCSPLPSPLGFHFICDPEQFLSARSWTDVRWCRPGLSLLLPPSFDRRVPGDGGGAV